MRQIQEVETEELFSEGEPSPYRSKWSGALGREIADIGAEATHAIATIRCTKISTVTSPR